MDGGNRQKLHFTARKKTGAILLCDVAHKKNKFTLFLPYFSFLLSAKSTAAPYILLL
jgi:hypothetical protein